MSLLGFDALGRWALAQLPDNGNFALVTVRGSAAVAGQAVAFGTSSLAGTAGFLVGAIPAGFRVAESANAGPVALAGSPVAFGFLQSSFGGSFLLAVAAANSAIRTIASPGAVLLSATPRPLVVSLASGRGAFAWAGGGSTYDWDHEAWVRRPFDAMSWQTEATLPPPSWSDAAPLASVWAADLQPQNAWTPASIEPEPWTRK